jgi:hypothetical protein
MKMKVGVLIASITFAMNAGAEPTLYPPDLSVLASVRNFTTSNILADEMDSKTVWVMPPNTATASVSGLHSKTSNMGYCAEMRDLQTYSSEISAEISKIMLKRSRKQDELDALQMRADKLNESAQSYAAENGFAALAEMDGRIADLETRLTELYNLSQNCTANCDELSTEIRTVIEAKRLLLKDRSAFAKQNTADLREYNMRKKRAEAAAKTAQNARRAFLDLSNELNNLSQRHRETYASFGELEGGRAALKYETLWDENVQKLREENPGIHFSKIATQNAMMMTELAGLPNIDPRSAIKAIAGAGVLENGVSSFTAYPPSFSSNIVLSLIGACPLEHPEYFDLKENKVDAMKYGVIITYEYQTVFTFKATAFYNMHKMYEKIVSSGKKGGFFRSRSWSSVTERNFFSDSFRLKWDDKEKSVSAEDREVIEDELRRNVLTRLATLAIPNAPNRADIIAAAPPPKNGAIVASESLMKTCPANVYCAATAAVLQIMDAIFGSSSSTASYKNIQDYEFIEGYERTQKVTKSAITSYL